MTLRNWFFHVEFCPGPLVGFAWKKATWWSELKWQSKECTQACVFCGMAWLQMQSHTCIQLLEHCSPKGKWAIEMFFGSVFKRSKKIRINYNFEKFQRKLKTICRTGCDNISTWFDVLQLCTDDSRFSRAFTFLQGDPKQKCRISCGHSCCCSLRLDNSRCLWRDAPDPSHAKLAGRCLIVHGSGHHRHARVRQMLSGMEWIKVWVSQIFAYV